MQKKKNEALLCRFCLSGSWTIVYLIMCLVFLLLMLSACSKEKYIQLEHLQGALAWKQQNWNEAVLHFFQAEELAHELSEFGFHSYTNFALASSYLMQGENAAAKEKLQNIPETVSEYFHSQQFYQQGIIAFRAKKYDEAADLFKKSLMLYGNDVDAKINYELSKKFCSRHEDTQQEKLYNAEDIPLSERTEDSIIFDIIRKREQIEWKKIQHETEPAINDY